MSRVFLLQLAVCCLLTSCSPEFIQPLESKTSTPEIVESGFISYDSTKLPLRKWLPSGDISGVIVALHGFNDYSNFINDSAPYFNAHKLALYAYDQRGFGETESRGRWSGWQTMANDLVTFLSLVRSSHPETPLFILGDSMGGAVAIVAMSGSKTPEINGVILVAPAVWARSQMPLYQRFALWLAAHTIPWKEVTGESLDIMASDNIDMLRELGRDPLVIKETRIGALYGLSNLMDAAYSNAEYFGVRSLLLYGEKDEIIPREPVVDFYQRLPLTGHGEKRKIFYENGYHMLLRDLQADTVREDIVSWIVLQTSS